MISRQPVSPLPLPLPDLIHWLRQPLAGTANGKGKGKGAKRRNQIIRSPPLMSSEAPVM